MIRNSISQTYTQCSYSCGKATEDDHERLTDTAPCANLTSRGAARTLKTFESLSDLCTEVGRCLLFHSERVITDQVLVGRNWIHNFSGR